MEIFSIRSSQSFQFRKRQDNPARPEAYTPAEKNVPQAAPFPDIGSDAPNYASISSAEIREIARRSFESGAIDHDTFSTLSEGLPMQAIDRQGQIVDLSDIGDTTPFDFRNYFEDQLAIAASLGDQRNRAILESVVAFLNS